MTLNAFDDKSRQLTDAELARVLKGSIVFWNQLKERIASTFTPLTFEWGFTSKTTWLGIAPQAQRASHPAPTGSFDILAIPLACRLWASGQRFLQE